MFVKLLYLKLHYPQTVTNFFFVTNSNTENKLRGDGGKWVGDWLWGMRIKEGT